MTNDPPAWASHGPYTFDYAADADRIELTDAEGTTWSFPDAGLDPGWPEGGDVEVTEAFCAAVLGHAYRVTSKIHTNPARKRRTCQLCGKQQTESPQRWTDDND